MFFLENSPLSNISFENIFSQSVACLFIHLIEFFTELSFSCSVTSDSVVPWTAACQALLSSTISWSLLRFTAIEPVMLSNHLILCCPLLLLPSIFSSIKVFSNESAVCSRWPNYWSFGFSSSPSNEYSGLISFRMDWFDLLAVQGTLKSLLQYHNSKAQTFVAQPSLWSKFYIYT